MSRQALEVGKDIPDLRSRVMRTSSSSGASTPYRSSRIWGDTAPPNQIMTVSPFAIRQPEWVPDRRDLQRR
jgi:hypothetical protein